MGILLLSMSTYGRSNQSWSHKKPKKQTLQAIYTKLQGFFSSGELWKNLLLLGLICFFIGTFLFFALFAWYSHTLPDPGNLIERSIPLSTKIYDNTGEHLLYEISSGEKRTLVTIDQIPENLKKATLAAEDRNFYEHAGIDFKGIARAVYGVVTFRNLGGGSTLTQQLVKNAILTNERTLARKMKEIILSLALERRYTKEEILQMYLNEIPYGSTNYGAESAARAYFGKSVSNLTLAECATLAALPQAPTTYLNNPDRLTARRNWILESMAELEYISEEEKSEALSQETLVKANIDSITAPHFVLWVKEQLVEMFDERTVEEGGLKVITSLDFEKQLAAEEVLETNVKEKGPALGYNNASLVSLSPTDGAIIAMVGSADYFNDDIDGQVNVALRPRQPGSSFKPIIYAAAFERGYTPNTLLWDVKTSFPSSIGPYTPKNYDGKEHGPLSIRTSLQWSLNIPAVKTLYLVGVEQGLQFAERLGYTSFADRSRFGLAVVLGGGEVTALEHAAAYGVFASEGTYHPAYAIKQVEDAKGNMLYTYNAQENEKKVLDANVTRMISNVLSDDPARAAVFGAGSNLTLPGRPAAAKTGTTNDSKDAWTAGYTPDIVTVVWAGNTDGHAMTGAGGASAAGPIWNGYMRKAHEGLPVKQFTAPSIPVTGKAMLDGQMPVETFFIDTSTGLLATENTPQRFREEKTCGEYHNILSYVDVSDPLGAPPADPASANSVWTEWEAAVQGYISRHNAELKEGQTPYESCQKPTESDDAHTRANQPSVNIVSPRRNDTVSRSIQVDVSTNIPRGTLSRIEYFIDTTLIDVGFRDDSKTIQVPSWVDSGNHTLMVRLYDDIDNMGEDRVAIEITGTVQAGEASVVITNPFPNQEIILGQDMYPVAIEVQGERISSLFLETLRIGETSAMLTQERVNPSSIERIPWGIQSPGAYLLRAYGVSSDGERFYSSFIPVFVRSAIAVTPPAQP